jgi:hypothetical protein
MATIQQDQFIEFAKSGQAAINEAVHTWAENVQAFAGTMLAQPKVPSAVEIVDNAFDVAEQLLATQRQFAKSLLAAGAQATEVASAQAREATDKAVKQVVKSADVAAEQAKATAERTARSAKNAS